MVSTNHFLPKRLATIEHNRKEMFKYNDMANECAAAKSYAQAVDAYIKASKFCISSNTRHYTAAIIDKNIAFCYSALIADLQNEANYLTGEALQDNIKQQKTYLRNRINYLKSSLDHFESDDRVREHEKQQKIIQHAQTYISLAGTYKDQYKLDKALVHALKGLDLLMNMTYPINEIPVSDLHFELTGLLIVIACYQQKNMQKNTIPYYKRAIEIHSQLEMRTGQVSTSRKVLESYLKEAEESEMQEEKSAPLPEKKHRSLFRTVSTNHPTETPKTQTAKRSRSFEPITKCSVNSFSILGSFNPDESSNKKSAKPEAGTNHSSGNYSSTSSFTL